MKDEKFNLLVNYIKENYKWFIEHSSEDGVIPKILAEAEKIDKIEQSEPVTVSDEEIEKWVESSKEEQAKYDNGIVTTEQRTEVLLNQLMSCHPSREENLQVREAIRFLAKQIDIIHKLRILAKKGGKE